MKAFALTVLATLYLLVLVGIGYGIAQNPSVTYDHRVCVAQPWLDTSRGC